MTHTLTIIDTAHPGRPPLTMNEYERAHYRKQTAAKRRIQWQIKAALQTTPIPTLNQATVSIMNRPGSDGGSGYLISTKACSPCSVA